jgi:hypothetical protein
MVDLERFELSTSSLQMMRSSQLNYRPIIALRASPLLVTETILTDLGQGLCPVWWAHLGSNQGPQSYQDCALAS